MATKKRPAETFAQLLDTQAPGEGWEAFAIRAKVSSRTVWRLRKGDAVRPYRGTLASLAKALRCDPERVRAAIEASRAAAN